MKRLSEEEAIEKIAAILAATGLDVPNGTLVLVGMAGKIASECAKTEAAFRGWKRDASDVLSRIPWSPVPDADGEDEEHEGGAS